MSNSAFDAMVRRQEIKNVRATIANMEAAMSSDDEAAKKYCARALPLEKQRLAWLVDNWT